MTDPRPDPTGMSAPEYAATLTQIGLNIVVRNLNRELEFLSRLFGIAPIRQDGGDFAIIRAGNLDILLHLDGTYPTDHAMVGVLPENPPRGAGIEIRLYDIDPDGAAANASDDEILIAPNNRPHGLREGYFASPDGYIYVPSRPIP